MEKLICDVCGQEAVGDNRYIETIGKHPWSKVLDYNLCPDCATAIARHRNEFVDWVKQMRGSLSGAIRKSTDSA
jgi:rubredoxin